MASNIEIKARARAFPRQAALAAELATGGPIELVQRDTFFRAQRGRLKLREFADGSAELIRYERPDTREACASHYDRIPVVDGASLAAVLGEALGVVLVVSKRRTVWFAGRTRIHLDRVEDLGEFIELEVVLAPGEPSAGAIAEAEALAARLAIAPEDRIAAAYVDLLLGACPT